MSVVARNSDSRLGIADFCAYSVTTSGRTSSDCEIFRPSPDDHCSVGGIGGARLITQLRLARCQRRRSNSWRAFLSRRQLRSSLQDCWDLDSTGARRRRLHIAHRCRNLNGGFERCRRPVWSALGVGNGSAAGEGNTRPLADLRPHRPICAEVVGRGKAQTEPYELFRRNVHIAPPPIGLGGRRDVGR
jgi:hypothetical protein